MRKALLGLAVAAMAGMLAGPTLAADNWPTQPIHIIVPFPSGGQAEIVTRIIAEKISPVLGQPVLVEAKPGANGDLGSELVAKSKPDGYTWLATGVPLTTSPAMHPSHPPFDPIKDFEAGAEIGTTSFVIAVPGSLPVKTLADFIAYAKAHKGQMSYAGSGIGSLVHLASEMFKLEAGVDMQLIPYTGQPPAIADLLAGRDQFMVLGLSLAEPLLKSGQLKALAILDDQRSPLIPDVPTIGEAGYPDLAINGWAGLHAPAGTPKPVIDRMNAVIMDAISNPDVKSQVEKLGWDVAPKNTPAQFEAFVEKELARWAKVIKDAHVKTL